MNDPTGPLDRLLDLLEKTENNAAAKRTTGVPSPREDPAVVRFREDLTNGLVRLDSVNGLVRWIADVLAATRVVS